MEDIVCSGSGGQQFDMCDVINDIFVCYVNMAH